MAKPIKHLKTESLSSKVQATAMVTSLKHLSEVELAPSIWNNPLLQVSIKSKRGYSAIEFYPTRSITKKQKKPVTLIENLSLTSQINISYSKFNWV